jgi:hypothetical protein
LLVELPRAMMPVIRKPDITKKISMPMKPVSRKWQTAGDLRESKNPKVRGKSRLPNRAFSKLRNGLFGTLKNSRKIPFIQ